MTVNGSRDTPEMHLAVAPIIMDSTAEGSALLQAKNPRL